MLYNIMLVDDEAEVRQRWKNWTQLRRQVQM